MPPVVVSKAKEWQASRMQDIKQAQAVQLSYDWCVLKLSDDLPSCCQA
jgi:hypothetical protein